MFWDEIREALYGHFKAEPIENFMTWPEIVTTMVVGNVGYIQTERDYLIHDDWSRWKDVVELEYKNRPNTNLIHQAYHLARWEKETGLKVSSLERIVEIGGGYGAMALIARRAGFTGRYIVFDFPELGRIQEFYWKEMGVSAETYSEFSGAYADLFIGLFSLSEMGYKARSRYVDGISEKHVLIAALDAPWEGINPLADLEQRFPGARRITVEHIPGRVYLIG